MRWWLRLTIGENRKKFRTIKGITQKEFGLMVGLSDVRIQQYELNIRTPKDIEKHYSFNA
jgi:transcriptional regulator with XRE-family HTH domain